MRSDAIDLGQKAHALSPHDKIPVGSRDDTLEVALVRCTHEVAVIRLSGVPASNSRTVFLDYLDDLDDLDYL